MRIGNRKQKLHYKELEMLRINQFRIDFWQKKIDLNTNIRLIEKKRKEKRKEKEKLQKKVMIYFPKSNWKELFISNFSFVSLFDFGNSSKF